MDSFIRDRVASSAAGSVDLTDSARRNRDSLFLMARVRLGDSATWAEVRVRNLSAGGLMAELDQPLTIGSSIELELRGVGRVNGRIAWQAEGRVGVAFHGEIDPKKARKPVGGGTMTPIYAKAPVNQPPRR